MKYIIAILLVVVCTRNVEAQTNCYFNRDEQKIDWDVNLDFFLHKMETRKFAVHHKRQEFPAFVCEQLTCIFQCSIDSIFANPDEHYNTGCLVFQYQPKYQLSFFGVYKNIYVIVSKHGGDGYGRHIICMQFRKKRLVDLWDAEGYGRLKDMEEVVRYLRPHRFRDGLHGFFSPAEDFEIY